jgi:hypothetical protein
MEIIEIDLQDFEKKGLINKSTMEKVIGQILKRTD